MTAKHSKFLLTVIIMCVSACSDTETYNEPTVKPYVTNAEYVLERIESGESTGVAFQVKPTHRKACKSMYIEIGKQDAEGFWGTTNTLFPGKDSRDNFGQATMNDQIHFAEVDGEGNFAVLALGCEPYGDKLKVTKGLLATFDVEFGKLNYVGEIALITRGASSRRFAAVEVTDRSEFALSQIQSQLPALETHFQPSIMKKYAPEITPEMRAELDRLAQQMKKHEALAQNANRTIAARNKLFEEQKKARAVLDRWDDKHGYPQKDLTQQQTDERNKLVRQVGRLLLKIDRYDEWIDRNIDFNLTQKYMALEASAERADRKLKERFPINYSDLLLAGKQARDEVYKSPEYIALSQVKDDADAALDDFAKRHDM